MPELQATPMSRIKRVINTRLVAAEPAWTVPPDMDKECIALCKAMNRIPGIVTTCSCCGHGDRPYRVWFMPHSLESLPRLLYWFDNCHCGFRDWKVITYTDCAGFNAFFMVEGPTGEEAYKQAEHIAILLLGEASKP